MEIACMSDIHGEHIPEKHIPEADVLVIAGDATKRGCHREFMEFVAQLKKWYRKFSHVVYVPGKHDVLMEHHPERYIDVLESAVPNAKVLIHTDIKIGDVKMWGTPYSVYDKVWAFTEKEEKRKYLFSRIPRGTDVIISYSPPWSILDLEQNNKDFYYHSGCKYLLQTTKSIQPKLHIFGGSHANAGELLRDDMPTKFINASITKNYTSPLNQIIVTEI